MADTNKTDLTAAIAAETGLTQQQSAAALGAALRLIQAAVARGERVALVGFGTFEIHAYSAPGGHGPWTGRAPAFRPGEPFRRAVHAKD